MESETSVDVLVVEDDDDSRAAMDELLTARGHVVRSVGTAEAAFDAAMRSSA